MHGNIAGERLFVFLAAALVEVCFSNVKYNRPLESTDLPPASFKPMAGPTASLPYITESLAQVFQQNRK